MLTSLGADVVPAVQEFDEVSSDEVTRIVPVSRQVDELETTLVAQLLQDLLLSSGQSSLFRAYHITPTFFGR